jgi:two-component system sensor histidine kinase VicK
VVEAINKEHNQNYTDQDREAFEVFGSQAAIAIENARLFSAVMREKEKLNTVFAEMSDGVMLLDDQGKVILLNNAGGRFLGLKSEEAVGKIFGADLFPGFESVPPIQDPKTFKEKVTMIELVRKEPKGFYLTALVLKLQSVDAKNLEGFLVILHDTTEEKRGERLKQNFLSLISHKLKTPLTVIVGYGPILMAQLDGMNEFQKKAVKSVCQQGEQLSGLVDKLLRFTIVESETLKRESEPKAVAALVKEAMEGVESMKEGKKVEMSMDASVNAMPEVLVDGPLTVEVFKNLFENAIKFNDKESKTILVKSEKSNGMVEVHVLDNGVGIPAEEREKVFQKFYQIESSFTGQVPGAGLGLALWKKVVEAMGGKIQLQSELGKGTRVSVTLPTKKS